MSRLPPTADRWGTSLAAMSPGRGRARVYRGLTLSAACLATPAVAHVAAGGGVPAAGPLLFVAALLSVACVALADRRRTAGEIAAILLLSQPVLHVLFALSGHGTAAVVPSPAMAIGHGLAALSLTAILAGAEALTWSLAALSATVLLRRARALFTFAARAVVPAAPPHGADASTPAYVRHLTDTAPRRGPPVIACS